VQLPVWFRSASDPAWWHGSTENVSKTGILFHADSEAALALGASLEIGLVLQNDAVAPQVLCRGKIVRAEAGPPDSFPTLAAKVLRWHFVGGRRANPFPGWTEEN